MITIKLGELKSIIEGLNEIAGEKLPVKVSWAFNKVAKKIVKEYQTFEETRMKLAMSLCEKDDKGVVVTEKKPDESGKLVDQFKFSDEKRTQFNKEFNELCNIDLELNAYPVKLSQFGDDVSATPTTLMKLEKLIIDDAEPKVEGKPELKIVN